MSKTIKFFSNKSRYAELSNFWVHQVPLEDGGVSYQSSEHIFQSKKFVYPGALPLSKEYGKTVVARAASPFEAKVLGGMQPAGRGRALHLNSIMKRYKADGVKLRPNWDSIRLDVMRETLMIKFTQDLVCRQVLLSTRGCHLEEDSPYDKFWGTGGNGSGSNHLGKLLVAIREEFLLAEDVSADDFL